MSLSKLVLATALSLALAGGAVAQDSGAPLAAEPAAATGAANAAGAGDAAQAAVPSDAAHAAAVETDAVAPAAPAPESAAATEATQGEAPAVRMELGPVGHDAQGRPGRIHVVRAGDTLWDISDAYLGTPWVWPSLWKDNDAIRNPHLIHPADRIWISPYEMRKVSEAEAAALLAAQDQSVAAPASLAETDAMPPTRSLGSYRYTEIETAGFVTREQYEGAASILESAEPRKWLSEQSEVVIGLGTGEVQVGDQFDIFRTDARVTDLDTGMQYGWATTQLGWLEVTRVDEESSRAVIQLSRSEIQRGDHLLPRRVRSADIPIGSSPGPVEGRIVHTPGRRLQMSQTDIVYLDRGSRDGIAVGNPLEIYRPLGKQGKVLDSAQNRERRVADHVVAKLLVVDVYDDTSVAVVTHTTEELNRGDSFRGSDSIEP